jgi:hypothetical protein
MSVIIVNSFKEPINLTLSLLDKFIDVCPQDLWESTWGTWKVWQQVCHTLIGLELFNPLEMKKPLTMEIPYEEANLKVIGTNPISKEKVKENLKIAKKNVDDYLASLKDENLGDINQKFKEITKLEWTHAVTLTAFVSHTQYHIGVFDAALRERKLPGVF